MKKRSLGWQFEWWPVPDSTGHHSGALCFPRRAIVPARPRSRWDWTTCRRLGGGRWRPKTAVNRRGCCQSDGVGSLKSWQTMKEAYAVRRTVPPSAEIQAEIDKLLSEGMVDDPQKMLSALARLGARLIIQRAVEEEFDTWLGRARYERRPERQRGLRNYDSGLRNGFRPRHLQTAEGELRIEIPQAREAEI